MHVYFPFIGEVCMQYAVKAEQERTSLVPRPLPRFFFLAAMEKNREILIFLHGCEIKSGQRPGDEARRRLGARLGALTSMCIGLWNEAYILHPLA